MVILMMRLSFPYKLLHKFQKFVKLLQFAKVLATSISITLALSATASAADARIHKNIYQSGNYYIDYIKRTNEIYHEISQIS